MPLPDASSSGANSAESPLHGGALALPARFESSIARERDQGPNYGYP